METVYKENYLVKDDGTIISLHYKGGYKQVELKHFINLKGYHRVRLGQKACSVARIVWEAFNGQIQEGYEIDHIDGNKDNNHLSNLRAISHLENIRNPVTLEKQRKARNKFKIPVKVFDKEMNYINTYSSKSDVCKQLNIPHRTLDYLLENPKTKSKYNYIFLLLETEKKQ